MPELYVIAGANGSGKSTLTRSISAGIPIMDPDEIARELDPIQPARVSVSAARRAITLAQQYIDDSSSFLVETTLAGKNYLNLMNSVKQQCWNVNLVYIGIDNPETNIRRVRERVKRGGHNVPIEDIRRRYQRSLNNLSKAIELSDSVTIYDNSDRQYLLIATIESGIVTMHVDRYPGWCASIENLRSSLP
jgi:predicted ABC-type ATPase